MENAKENPLEKVVSSNEVTSRTGASEIRQWLEEQKRIIGRDSNNTVDKIIASMIIDEMYTEPNQRETFIIVPLDKRMPLSNNIRADLNEPLRYLLLVENEDGRIRKGDIVLFYPLDKRYTELPDSSFTKFFTNYGITVDGTFALISLRDIKVYEMDVLAEKPKEFRLWAGKPAVPEPVPDPPICTDWYEITTIFYNDGTYDQTVEFLYTQCEPNPMAGGGGGGTGEEPNCDPSLVSEEEVMFNDNLLMSAPSSINVTGPDCGGSIWPELVTGVANWIVVQGQIANWEVKAMTEYKYYHDQYYDLNLDALVNTYDLFHYKTISSYYVGSNTFIQTTWTQTAAIDQVFNNNTYDTKGVSKVYGTLRHVQPLPFNEPYCPKVLDVTQDVPGNTLNFKPR
ncbi:MAG: hypothetical protein JST57_08185 [Bacteroidetes bacterium]|mgnify:FL=1|nr:hypothetical protein [Bacteroidota bacterium]MBS1925967.1 hypothetical protein [Bacteroidota bacterium]HRD42668.1 hypothetical protein [Ferruginibacter sp.]